MTALSHPFPTRRLFAADLLKLRRRHGLVAVTSLLTVGAMAVTYGVIELLHVIDPAKHGPAGGIANLGHGTFVAAGLGAVAAAIVGSAAGVGDLDAGVYRDLVVTGRSRVALYASRIPAGLAFLLPFVAVGYAVAAVASVVFAGTQPVPSVHLLAVTGLWVVLEVTFYYLLAVGIACLVGSLSYTIGILLAWRLAITPILASISALGIVRELVPGVAIQALQPSGLGDSARQGAPVPMSVAAVAAVLVVWAVVALVAGGVRDATRDA
jgi:ABC-type transport system involved in multi-copper enzyme maturation permease subunit